MARLVPKAITFDVYGTLIDWEGEIQDYFKGFLEKKGITFSSIISRNTDHTVRY